MKPRTGITPAAVGAGTAGRSSKAAIVTTPAEIESVSYSILTLEDLQAAGAPIIVNPEYNLTRDTNSIRGTLYDPYMGHSSYSDRCLTCGLGESECQGHVGYIPFPAGFALPIPFTGSLVKFLLMTVCQHCGMAMFDSKDVERHELHKYAMPARIAILNKYVDTKGMMCPSSLGGRQPNTPDCGVIPNREIGFVPKEFLFVAKIKRGGRTESIPLDNAHVFRALTGITKETARTLGFIQYHPMDLMMRFFPVIPPSMREVTGQGYYGRTRDHMSSELRGIMKDLDDIKHIMDGTADQRKTKKAPTRRAPAKARGRGGKEGPSAGSGVDPKIADKTATIADRMLRVFGMKVKANASKDDQRGYVQMLSGKKGHLRHKMQGKRVDLTARTPAVPDPSIGLDEIGVPLAMAWPPSPNTLFQRVPILDHNIAHIQHMLSEGQVTRYFSSRDGKEFGIAPGKEIRLHLGDEVAVTTLDGADNLFNRNPSIHMLSVQGMRVRLVTGNAFRVHPAVVSEFNMDFDGDEGNVGIITGYAKRAEVRYVASSIVNTVNPEYSGATHGIIQDNVSAAYMMTNATDVPWQPVKIGYIMGILREQDAQKTLNRRLAHFGLTTGSPRGLLSATLPSTFSYKRDGVVISRGVIVKGTVAKAHIGAGERGSIAHYISHFDYIYGVRKATDFLFDFTVVTGEWISVQRGLTITYDDTHVGDPRVEEMRSQVLAEVKETVRTIHADFEPIDEVDKHRQEQEITAVVNKGESMGTKVTDEVMVPYNPMRISIVSKAKGSRFHSANITAILGQQFVMNERPTPELPGDRFLVYSQPFSKDPEDHGFTVSNYGSGLDPASCFLQQASTRPLIADTSLKTADVGDLAHRVGLSLENCVVSYAGTVLDHAGRVVSFLSGVEGEDPRRALPRKGSTFGIAAIELANIANAYIEQLMWEEEEYVA